MIPECFYHFGERSSSPYPSSFLRIGDQKTSPLSTSQDHAVSFKRWRKGRSIDVAEFFDSLFIAADRTTPEDLKESQLDRQIN